MFYLIISNSCYYFYEFALRLYIYFVILHYKTIDKYDSSNK